MIDLDKKPGVPRFSIATERDFQSESCATLIRYWMEKAEGRSRPKWRDISLMDVYPIAPLIVVRDVLDDGREFRCRFCGTGMTEILGFELTGSTLAEKYEPHGVDVMMRRYRAAVENGRPLRVVGYINVVEKNTPTGFESVVLPLDGDDGGIRHVISVHDLGYTPAPEELVAPS